MILLGKLALALSCAVLMPLAYRAAGRVALAPARFDMLYLGALLASRLATCVIVFGVLGLDVPSDAAGYYLNAARSAAAGGLVYRDFETSYAPLFPYVGAALLQLRSSAVVFVWLAIVLELVCARAWLSALRRLSSDELHLRQTAALCLLGPLSWFNVSVQGQNQIWVGAALALATLALVRGRELSSGLLLAFAVVSVKFLPLLFAPILGVHARRLGPFAVGLGIPVVAVYGLAYSWTGDAFLDPLRVESAAVSPGNLPYLIALLLGPLASTWHTTVWSAVRAAAYLALLAWCFVRTRRAQLAERVNLPAALALTIALLYLASHKAFAGYLVMVGWPLTWTLCARPFSRLDWAGFTLLTLTSTLESSILFRSLGGLVASPAQVLYGALPLSTRAWILLVETLTVAAHAWLAWRLVALSERGMRTWRR